jgi:hypothetical protein
VALAALWLLSWLALPPLLKWQAQKIATEKLGRAVHIGAVKFEPWALALTLRDVSVEGAQPTDEPQATIKRLYANVSMQSLLRLAPILQAVQVDEPVLRLRHLGEGHYDVDDVVARVAGGRLLSPGRSQDSIAPLGGNAPCAAGKCGGAIALSPGRSQDSAAPLGGNAPCAAGECGGAIALSPDAKDAKPTRFALYNIAVRGGRFTFIDEPVRRTHEVSDLTLTLPFITNRPSRSQVTVTPQLAFMLNGSRFDSGAQALPFDASRQTEAHLRLEQFDLAPYLVYQPAGMPMRVTAGVLDADLRLKFEQTPQPTLRITGTAGLSGVRANDAAGQQALAFERLAVEASDVRLLERAVHLSSVELTAPHVLASRDAQGQINWASKQAAAGVAPGAKSDGDWNVAVDRVAIVQGDVQWRDARPAPGAAEPVGTAAVHVAPLSFEVKNLRWPATQPATFSGRLALADVAMFAQSGQKRAAPKADAKPAANAAAPAATAADTPAAPSIAFQGQAQMTAAQLNVQARGLPLGLAQPYLAALIKPRLAGNVDADAALAWAAPAADAASKNTGKDASKDVGKNPGGHGADSAPGLTLDVGKLAFSHLALLSNDGAARAASRATTRATSRATSRVTTRTTSRATSRATPRDGNSTARADDLPPGTLAGIEALTLEGGKLDLDSRRLAIGAVTVQTPRVRIARDKDGRWMFEDWLLKPDLASPQPQAQPDAQPDAPLKGASPWSVRVGHVAVTGGEIGWRDRQPASGAVEVTLSQLKLDARDFDPGGAKPMPLELSALLAPRRGEPGKLSWRGTVGLAPIRAQGEVDAERLPAQAFEPYVSDFLNINILRADASFKGKVDYAQQDGGPRLRAAGDVRIEELRTTSRPGSATAAHAATAQPETSANANANAALAPDVGAAGGGLGEELLSWKQLRMNGLNVRLDPGRPPRASVKNSQLSDFYARIIVHPNGRINLQDVVKTAAAPQTVASAASAASNVSAPAAAGATSTAPRLSFGPTRLLQGRIAFSDHFIRPNYSADLTELDGLLGAHSSVSSAAESQAPQMADLHLLGLAQGTAQLAINGKLNPLADPLALDIEAKLTDLELAPLTPYAVKYSGHGIERGKLSMDVAYRITPDGQLTATNKLVLNQLEFGQAVPDAPASLPVTLATALLADGNGVINLDLPISGSLNDPQFSLAPVIFKAILNLIGKAITAPFALLANAFGGGSGDSDMSHVPFALGSAELSQTAKAQLDKIAKAMTDRPRIKLTLTGAARLADEREHLKRQRLYAMVAAERRASRDDEAPATFAAATPGASASAAAPAAPAVAQAAQTVRTAADYPQLLRRLYRRADIPGKPRNFVGMSKDVPLEQMESLLLAQISVSEDDIRQLATQRAMAVKDYLLAQHLDAERVFLGAAKTQSANAPAGAGASAAEPADWTPQVTLALSMR